MPAQAPVNRGRTDLLTVAVVLGVVVKIVIVSDNLNHRQRLDPFRVSIGRAGELTS